MKFSSIIILPESIVTRKVGVILEYLNAHGFQPVMIKRFQITRQLMNSIRGYIMKPTTRQSIFIRRELDAALESLFLVVRMNQEVDPANYDTSTCLSNLKGSAFKELREDWQLRSLLNSQHPVLKYIHSPDNQDNFFNEYKLITGQEFNPSAFEGATKNIDVNEVIEDIYKLSPEVNINFKKSIISIIDRISTCADGEVLASTDILKKLSAVDEGFLLDWEDLFIDFERLPFSIDLWDRLILAVFLTECTE